MKRLQGAARRRNQRIELDTEHRPAAIGCAPIFMAPAVRVMATLVDAALDEVVPAFGALAPLRTLRRAPVAASPVTTLSVTSLVFVPPIVAPAPILNDTAVFEGPAIGLRSPVRGDRFCVKHRSRSPHPAPKECSGSSAYRDTTTETVHRSPPARTR